MERVCNDLIAELDAFIAYINSRSCDKLFDLIMSLAAERTLQVHFHLF